VHCTCWRSVACALATQLTRGQPRATCQTWIFSAYLEGDTLQGHILVSRQSVQKVTKVAKVKGQSTGRTYTSKYRGVHQTFPTKRWEAQFRCASPTWTHVHLSP